VVTGSLTLNADGKYMVRANEIGGHLHHHMRFGTPAYEQYRSYKVKAADLGLETIPEKPANIGFLVLGPANWKFTPDDIFLPGRVNVIALQSPLQARPLHSLLNDKSQSEVRLEKDYDYQVLQGQDGGAQSPASLPIQVVVSFSPDSNRQALDIELELTNADIPGDAKISIEQIVLWMPNSLGKIERLLPEGKIEDSAGIRPNLGGECQSITWRKLIFERKYESSRRLSLYIRFQDPIDAATRLEGELEIKIPVAFSGAHNAKLFMPWGGAYSEQSHFDAETTVKVALDLDLNQLRYQTLKSLEKEILREGVVPDSKMVSELITTISNANFYVKRVSENPARTSKEGAHKINRYWDIAGRQYDGVYPVDFHLVLTGEETVHRGGGYSAGQLKVEMSVQGAVTDEVMDAKVQGVCDQLERLICSTLDRIPLATTASASEQIPIVEVEPLIPEEKNPVVEKQPTVVSIKEPVQADTQDRQQKLIERIDRLEERLLEGAISEKLYLDLKAKYEQELNELKGVASKPAKKAASSSRKKS